MDKNREFFDINEPKAIRLLVQGRESLVHGDWEQAMARFEECYSSRITRKLAALLLLQMANCMDNMEEYDKQREYLEHLCELELNFSNVQRLMKIYVATNDEDAKRDFAHKIKELPVSGDKDEMQIIQLLVQAKDHEEVLSRALERIEKKPDDYDTVKIVMNTYSELKRIEEAYNLSQDIINEDNEHLFYMELSGLHKEMFDFESSMDYLLKHLKLHEGNYSGVNTIAHTVITSACYNGILKGEDYIYWQNRAYEGTKPQTPINTDFDINTDYFRKIRVGVISYDFRAHSVGKFCMSLFDSISNNTGIETYCYYTHPSHKDKYTEVIEARADVFKYVGRFSNKQLRKVLLEDKLDILVDLNGQTAGTKIALLTERFAPVQATWMGFPFSSFYYNIDYNIGDYYFDPIDGETWKYCTEDILRMYPCYMCFSDAGVNYYINPEPPQARKGYITLGMMNGPQKFSEESIRVWQKCLDTVPNSRLMIVKSSHAGEFLEGKLRERFERFGLDLSRVDIIINNEGTPGYYGRYNEADVMLDSFPFGGGTTTPEALWMGVPVIGCGYHMRHSRMAYSFMTNVGLGSLCADNIDEYPQKVREVATNLPLLRSLRKNLREGLKDTPLYNTEVFRNAFENAMRNAFVNYCIEIKKPFDPSVYNDDEVLLRDCVRAADILTHEFTREYGKDDKRIKALFSEYKEIHMYFMQRLSVIFSDNITMLCLAEMAARMLESLMDLSEDYAPVELIQSIRSILIRFA